MMFSTNSPDTLSSVFSPELQLPRATPTNVARKWLTEAPPLNDDGRALVIRRVLRKADGQMWRGGQSAIALVVASIVMVPARSAPDKYELYAVRYATLASFQVSNLVEGADRARRLDIAMMIWVLKGINGRVAIVDSGFHRERYFRQFSVTDYVKPSEAIAPLGIKPEDVTDILLSHMHWDHAGGVDLFPSARVWVQKDEYDYYAGEAWQSTATHAGVDPDDVMEIVRRNIAGRVSFIRGDDDTSVSGIMFGVGGKHTWQSQFVGAQTRSHTVVFASDNMFLYENLTEHKPIAATFDAACDGLCHSRPERWALPRPR